MSMTSNFNVSEYYFKTRLSQKKEFKMYKLVISIISTLALVGCATPDFNYQAESINISEPPIHTVNTSFVGDVMLQQGKYSEHEAIYVSKMIDTGFAAYEINRGYYLKKGEDEDTNTYLPSSGVDAGSISKAALADPWQAVMTYKMKTKICVITIFNALSCTESADYTEKMKPVLTDDSFQQTLIYSGKVGQKINIGYRETSNNVARPAFNNDVEYDLSESNIIGYKGAQLEIIEATNQYIKYRVLKNFNKAVY